MALKAKSLFLYGFQVTENNSSLDFKAASGGAELRATLTIGYYSLTSLATEIVKQMQAVDLVNNYAVSVNRNVAGGTQNRVTISTSGTYLSLLFGSGARAGSACASLLGFNQADQTGATSYTATATCGVSVLTNQIGYNYIPPELARKTLGSLNVSASGQKEAIVWAIQSYTQAQFKYIPKAAALADWATLLSWMVLQRGFEFTPEVTYPTVFYEATLESTASDGKGLGFQMNEMLPNFPDLYDTGLLKFRLQE